MVKITSIGNAIAKYLFQLNNYLIRYVKNNSRLTRTLWVERDNLVFFVCVCVCVGGGGGGGGGGVVLRSPESHSHLISYDTDTIYHDHIRLTADKLLLVLSISYKIHGNYSEAVNIVSICLFQNILGMIVITYNNLM